MSTAARVGGVEGAAIHFGSHVGVASQVLSSRLASPLLLAKPTTVHGVVRHMRRYSHDPISHLSHHFSSLYSYSYVPVSNSSICPACAKTDGRVVPAVRGCYRARMTCVWLQIMITTWYTNITATGSAQSALGPGVRRTACWIRVETPRLDFVLEFLPCLRCRCPTL